MHDQQKFEIDHRFQRHFQLLGNDPQNTLLKRDEWFPGPWTGS